MSEQTSPVCLVEDESDLAAAGISQGSFVSWSMLESPDRADLKGYLQRDCFRRYKRDKWLGKTITYHGGV